MAPAAPPAGSSSLRSRFKAGEPHGMPAFACAHAHLHAHQLHAHPLARRCSRSLARCVTDPMCTCAASLPTHKPCTNPCPRAAHHPAQTICCCLQGSYGSVYEISRLSDGQMFACKVGQAVQDGEGRMRPRSAEDLGGPLLSTTGRTARRRRGKQRTATHAAQFRRWTSRL